MWHEKVVYVCSALSGDIDNNISKAIDYCKYTFLNGFTPYAPHIMFTSFLDDRKAVERDAGMEMADVMLRKADELWVFSENGRISTGMHREIDLAKKLGMPINHFNIEETDVGKTMIRLTTRLDPNSALVDANPIMTRIQY